MTERDEENVRRSMGKAKGQKDLVQSWDYRQEVDKTSGQGQGAGGSHPQARIDWERGERRSGTTAAALSRAARRPRATGRRRGETGNAAAEGETASGEPVAAGRRL